MYAVYSIAVLCPRRLHMLHSRQLLIDYGHGTLHKNMSSELALPISLVFFLNRLPVIIKS